MSDSDMTPEILKTIEILAALETLTDNAPNSEVEDYWRKAHLDAGYELLYTPHIANLDLWKTSGHFDFYRENMFDQMEIEAQQHQLKPMNCPFHVLTYQSHLHSYRELPIRWAELGTVYRYERSGVLHGLMQRSYAETLAIQLKQLGY